MNLVNIFYKAKSAYIKFDNKKELNKLWKIYSSCVELKNLTTEQVYAIQEYWKPLVGHSVPVRWHQLLYSLTGEFHVEYEPFEICLEVQNRLSPFKYAKVLDDKGLYRSILSGFNIPTRLAESYLGVYYLPSAVGNVEVDEETFIHGISNCTDAVIKPSVTTSGGVGVTTFNTRDGVELTTNKPVKDYLDEYIERFGRSYCIEEKIKECDNLSKLNPSSCNTLRVHTFRSRMGGVKFLSSYIRIGRKGQVVDNAYSGGICARIDNKGCLSFAVSAYPYKEYYETDSGVQLCGYKIENYNRIIKTVLEAHSKLPMFNLIGWDVLVDSNNKVVIIEFNPNPDVRIEQVIFRNTCMLDLQLDVIRDAYRENRE